MRTLWMLIVFGALAVAACKKQDEPRPQKRETETIFDASIVPPSAKKPKMDAAQARKIAGEVVDRWLAAQNKGDFEAYSRLYADAFTGIRRSGAKRVELDRAGWLADRKRMFSKPTRVEISDVQTTMDAKQARVRFVQRWASGTYEDIGPKRLVVDLDAKRIVSEEMISSTVVMSLRKAARALELSADDIEKLSCEELPGDATRVVCVVDSSNDELLAQYTVAVLRKGTSQWTALDRQLGSVETTEMSYGPVNTASVDSVLEEIAKGKFAIAVTAASESQGGWGPEVDDPGGHERKAQTKWFAVDGDELHEILSFDFGGSSELDYAGEFVEVSLDVTENVANGYFTIEKSSETTAWGDDVGHGMYDPKIDTTTTELRWDPDSREYQ